MTLQKQTSGAETDVMTPPRHLWRSIQHREAGLGIHFGSNEKSSEVLIFFFLFLFKKFLNMFLAGSIMADLNGITDLHALACCICKSLHLMKTDIKQVLGLQSVTWKNEDWKLLVYLFSLIYDVWWVNTWIAVWGLSFINDWRFLFFLRFSL